MKRICFFLMTLMGWFVANAQGELPEFSTEGNPVWYQVKFKTGGAYLEDQGADANLKTANGSIKDEQLWQFIGNPDNFKMKSRAGNYVDFGNSRFTTSTTGADLKLILSPRTDAEGYFEIGRVDESKTMNQWGGTGAGKEIGEWNAGDTNNPLSFTKVNTEIFELFSTEDAPMWYQVQFQAGGAYLTDKGADANLQTAARSTGDEQKWQLIGDATSFKMKSKTGRYVTFSDGNFKASSTGVDLKIIESTRSGSEGYWEIQCVGESQSMNQVGGTGAGKNLGKWTAGDTNNPLSFISMSVKLPEFSTADLPKWYFIRSKKGQNVLVDNGVDEAVRLGTSDPVDEQLWWLEGTQDNFQLINKAGHYAVISDVALGADEPSNGGACSNPLRTSATAYTGGFSLAESTNATYSPAWIIKANGHTGGYFNAWGGTQNGSSIGLWTDTGDANNAFEFVDVDKMAYKDYKSIGIESFVPENKLTLWYTEPATTAPLYASGDGYSSWMEYSLPIGNGQFGASIFGGIQKDEIQFNEKTLWSGRSTDVSSEYGDYENFGSVYAELLDEDFGYASTEAAQDYYRLLDLNNAIAKVSFKNPTGTVTYKREYIASNPDGVVVARYTAENGKVNLRFFMESGKPGIVAYATYADGEGTFKGSLETISYNARFKVVHTGGTMTTGLGGVTVRDADEVLVILAGATDFDAYSDTYVSGTAQLADKVQALVNDASAKTWDELYSAHLADHKSYFDRCNFELAGTENNIPTNELIDTYDNGNGANALMLEQLYFAYGRYLEIGSSRGVDLPSNLQGIWNNMSEARWNCDIHSNINVQMNYWPAEPTNLSEMHVPFLNYIINMAESPQWKAYAATAGQNEGWTFYTENNIFGGCGSFMHNYVISNAWYCTHLWQHYRYTLDKEYLKKAFPAMWTCSRFWVLRLIEDEDGTWVCPQEYSPEHGPTQDGVAHAQQLVWDLFANTVAAAEILGDEAGVDAEQLELLKERLENLDKGLATETYDKSVADWGNAIPDGAPLLREWKESNYNVGENGHRHMSHLMCVYPFNQVTPESPYFDAAVNSMKLRGDGATGWSMGWKINLWARVLDGDHARQILRNALKHSVGGAGVYYNLYDAHAPFQIDGNFGACAGIAEMLMQSHTDIIQILPALPSAWTEGSIKGLKAVGDFTVDIAWKEGKATRATIVSNQGQPLVVKCQDIVGKNVYVNGALVTVTELGTDKIEVPANVKDVVVIDFDETYETETQNLWDAQKDIAAVLHITFEEFAQANNNVYAAAGKNYYRFTNNTHNKVIGIKADGKPAGVDASDNDINQIWLLQVDGEGFKLVHPNKKAADAATAYLPNMANASATQFTSAANAGTYTIKVVDAAAKTFRLSFGSDGNDCINMEPSGYSAGDFILDRWGGTNAIFTGEKAESVTLGLSEVGGASYATTYLPFDVTTTGDVKAYIGTLNDDNTAVTLVKLENGKIPTGEGVVLYSPNATTTATLTLGHTNTTKNAENIFKGTYLKIEGITKEDYYILGIASGAIGFYKPKSTTLAANRIYIPSSDVPSTVAALKLDFGGETTDIKGIRTESNADNVLYDLSGRRVLKAVKGIYIRNGKKVYVK